MSDLGLSTADVGEDSQYPDEENYFINDCTCFMLTFSPEQEKSMRKQWRKIHATFGTIFFFIGVRHCTGLTLARAKGRGVDFWTSLKN